MEELYNLLKEDGSYTGSYEQFVKDYGLNDDDYKEQRQRRQRQRQPQQRCYQAISQAIGR